MNTQFSSDLNLLQDVRTVQGLSVTLKGLPSLPIAKKYHGTCPVGAPKGKKPCCIFKNRSSQRRLLLSDQGLIGKLYDLFEGGAVAQDGPSQDSDTES